MRVDLSFMPAKLILFYLSYVYKLYNSAYTYTYCVCHYQRRFTVLIHFRKYNLLTMLDPKSKTKKTITLNKSINDCADSISIGNRIFFIGGFNSGEMYEIDFKKNTLIEKQSMLIPKYAHTLCNVAQYIYSIGGCYHLALNDSEKYSICQNNWRALPTLQTARCACAAFTFNDAHIYCSCGNNDSGTHLNSMEKLGLKEGCKWEYISVSNIFSPRGNVHGIQIGDNEVIVYGGYTVECYVLHLGNRIIECKRVGDMTVASDFYCCASPVFDGTNVYACERYRRIHMYSMADMKWLVVG